MAKVKVDISGLKDKIQNYARQVCRVAVGKIRDDLTNEAFTAIVKFYTSYGPKYYKRHYYNFMENSFQKYYANPHNKIYYGGVRLTPELMDDIYQDSVQEVFASVYAGFHGPGAMIGLGYAENLGITPRFFNVKKGDYTTNIADRMKPSPIEIILDKKEEIESNIQEYIDYAQKQVKF